MSQTETQTEKVLKHTIGRDIGWIPNRPFFRAIPMKLNNSPKIEVPLKSETLVKNGCFLNLPNFF